MAKSAIPISFPIFLLAHRLNLCRSMAVIESGERPKCVFLDTAKGVLYEFSAGGV
jgi:hypothetical protein